MDQSDNLNHRFTKVEVEDKTEVIMIDAIMISEVIRINIDQIVETGDNVYRRKVDLGMTKIIGEAISEVMQGILTDKIAE